MTRFDHVIRCMVILTLGCETDDTTSRAEGTKSATDGATNDAKSASGEDVDMVTPRECPEELSDQPPFQQEAYLDELPHISSNICADEPGTWGKGATINVCFERGSFNKAYMVVVRDAVRRTWEQNSALRFTGWDDNCTSTTPGIHILVADVNPASGVGKSNMDGRVPQLINDPAGGPLQVLDPARGGMVLNFDFVQWPISRSCTDDSECNLAQACNGHPADRCLDGICTAIDRPKSWYVAASAVHEFGHALGFVHEQARPDAPRWCKDTTDDASFPCDMDGGWEFDASSVMNYCNCYWNNDGELSAEDRRAVRHYYGDPSPCAGTGGQVSCDGECFDISQESKHCGACGNECDIEQVCNNGVCECSKPLVRCDAQCVRLGTLTNCAKCGDTCQPGESCKGAPGHKSCQPCRPCRCLDGFVAGPDACEHTPACRKICLAHGG